MLYPILENASAIRHAYEIATASERVAYMGGAVSRFGDIVADIGFRWTRARHRDAVHPREGADRRRAPRASATRSAACGAAPTTTSTGCSTWLTELRDIGYFGMMMGNDEHVRDRERGVHADAPTRSRTGAELDRLTREAEAADERVIYGDANQGEGHEIHIAHVATARKLLAWARELGVA